MSDEDIQNFLAHYGVKGMKWGVRRAAKKDAKEFARAKMFYGEGAGNRRKIIEAKVEGRSAKDPTYKKLFEEHLAKQDPSRHATKAVSERHRKDFTKRNKQRVGFVARSVTGEMGTQAAFTALVIGGGTFLASPRGQAIVKKTVANVKSSTQARRGAKMVANFMKTQGR